MYNRHEMLELVLIDGKARGIIARNLLNGKLERFGAHCVVLGTGGYGNVFTYLPTPWVLMQLPSGKQCAREPIWQILVLHKFIQRVFRYLAIINPN